MNKTKYAVMVLCAALILLAAVIGYEYLSANYDNEVPSTETAEEKDLAPDFTVYDGEGNPVKLSDFRGKPVVINFWATWCGYCMKGLPTFEKLAAEFEGEVVFMMINVTDGFQETKEKAKGLIEEKRLHLPGLLRYRTFRNLCLWRNFSSGNRFYKFRRRICRR